MVKIEHRSRRASDRPKNVFLEADPLGELPMIMVFTGAVALGKQSLITAF